jgi:hypothetical protein
MSLPTSLPTIPDDVSFGEDDDGIEDLTPLADIPLRSPGTPAAGMLFASPASSSGSTGGVLRKESDFGLIHVKDPRMVCGGAIGNTRVKFCSKENCEIVSHGKSKVHLLSDTLYVKCKREQARFQPSMEVAKLPMGQDLLSLMNDKRPLAVWEAFFDGLTAYEARTGEKELEVDEMDTWESVDKPNLDAFSRAESMVTPRRLRLDPILNIDEGDTTPDRNVSRRLNPLTDMRPTTSRLGPPPDRNNPAQLGVRTMLGEWDAIRANFEFLALEIEDISKANHLVKGALSETLGDMRAQLKDVINKTTLLGAKLGQAPIDAETNVWESVDQLRLDLADLKEILLSLKSSTQSQDTKGQKQGEELTALKRTLTEFSEYCHKSVPALSKQVKLLKKQLNVPKAGGSEARVSWAGGQGGSDILTQELDGLKEQVATLQATMDEHNLQDDNNMRMGGYRDNPFDEGGKPLSQLDHLLERVAEVERRVAKDSFEVGSDTFGSLPEVIHWVSQNEINSCGQFWDLFSILVIMKPKQFSGKDRADEVYSSTRIKTTNLENDLLASMAHTRPSLLFGKKGNDLVGSDEGFLGCPEYKKWMQGISSYKVQLTRLVISCLKGLKGNLKTSNSNTLVAEQMLMRVQSQWNSLVQFIEDFYGKLTQVANFPPDRAWLLVGKCVGAVFGEMTLARAEVVMLQDTELLENKAQIIWTTMRCHMIWDEFIELGFESHPAIVKEISLFMLTERVDPKDIKTFSVRVDSADARANQAMALAREAEEKCLAAKRAVDSLKNEMNTLKQSMQRNNQNGGGGGGGRGNGGGRG